MPHRNQRFLTFFLLLSAIWLLFLLEPVITGMTGAKCDKFGEAPVQLNNCGRLLPASGPLPEGIETIATIIAASGILLAAVASFELARKQA